MASVLTSEQLDLARELAASVAGMAQQHPVLRPFLVPHTFVRYLRARQWDLAKAEAMLRATLKWRLDYKPHALSWRDVEREAATGKLFVSPFPDREGRPVVVMRPRHENSRDREGQLRLLVYVLEVASRRADAAVMAASAAAAGGGDRNSGPSAPPPDGKMCWLVDFERYGLSNAPPLRTALATMEILQSHYPERLGKSICWRAPSLFSITWRAAAPLADPVTRQKIAFVEDAAQVVEHFHAPHVEACCGGMHGGDLFEREAYGAAMLEEEAEREAELKKAEEGYPGGFLPSGSSDASAASLVALAATASGGGGGGGARAAAV